MAFNHPSVVRTEMNCMGIACAWFVEGSGQCAVLERVAPKTSTAKKTTAKKTTAEKAD